MSPITFRPRIGIKKIFSYSPKQKEVSEVVELAKNRVEPLQQEFASVKEMFGYIKKRCMDAANSKTPYEHAIVADTKNKRIIAEYMGSESTCSLNDLKSLKMDKTHSIIFHDHPIGYPLSVSDIRTLIRNKNVNCVVAFNPQGEFSLAYKKIDYNPKKAKRAYDNFYQASAEDSMNFAAFNFDVQTKSRIINSNLRSDLPRMGVRYVTNYNNLVNKQAKYSRF